MNVLLPSLMHVHISNNLRPGHEVWLPVFVFWPLWLLVLLLFLVALVVATACTSSRSYRSAFAATLELHRLASGLRGAKCETLRGERHLRIAFV